MGKGSLQEGKGKWRQENVEIDLEVSCRPEALGIVTAMIQILSMIILEMINMKNDVKVSFLIVFEVDGGIPCSDFIHQFNDSFGVCWRCYWATMALQTNYTVHSYPSSCTGILVSASVYHDCVSLVDSRTIDSHSFFGRILGTSKDNLSFLGQIVSIFAEVSGEPYGTAIDLRRKSWSIKM